MYREKILKNLQQVVEVPTILSTALEISRLTQDPYTPASRIEDIIRLDVALASKVLKIANSALYAANKRIISLNQAIMRLGFSEVRKIALSIAFINSFKALNINYEQYWLHAITTAYLSQSLVEITNCDMNDFSYDDVFSCALVHDIGILILDQYQTILYKKIFEISKNQKYELHFVENKLLGVTHAEVGAFIFRKWNLPEAMVESILYHHNPESAENYPVLTKLIFLANFIANNRGYHNGTGFFPSNIHDDIWLDLGITVEKISEIIDKVIENIDNAKSLLHLGGR